MSEEPWVRDVLSFWFGELQEKDWFVRSDTVDERVRQRFSQLNDSLSRQVRNERPTSARHALALVIVLDQFPRNLFRDSPQAYATDHVALALAQRAINSGLDLELTNLERQFLYMPFQHAEDAEVQGRSMTLYAQLNMPEVLEFAARHKAIIDRFGRFPHRNEVLGRCSTQEELDFLKQPNSSF